MLSYAFILLAGGVGSRMNNAIPKQYMLLAGKPMIMHTLEKIDSIDAIAEIVIVCSDEYIPHIQLLLKQYNIKKVVIFAQAGRTRQESVFSGLKKVATPNVIIHEAARPFVTKTDYKQLIESENENTFFGIPIPFTVVKGHDYLEGILTRDELLNVQLPQKFNTKLLKEAHAKAASENRLFTEDVSLLYYYNSNLGIKAITGKDYNIKITTQTDIMVGEIIYDNYFRGRE